MINYNRLLAREGMPEELPLLSETALKARSLGQSRQRLPEDLQVQEALGLPDTCDVVEFISRREEYV